MCEVMGLLRIFRKNKIFKALYLTKVLLVQIGEEIQPPVWSYESITPSEIDLDRNVNDPGLFQKYLNEVIETSSHQLSLKGLVLVRGRYSLCFFLNIANQFHKFTNVVFVTSSFIFSIQRQRKKLTTRRLYATENVLLHVGKSQMMVVFVRTITVFERESLFKTRESTALLPFQTTRKQNMFQYEPHLPPFY